MARAIELCGGCPHLERRWLMGMAWCRLDNRPRGEREVACGMKRTALRDRKPAQR